MTVFTLPCSSLTRAVMLAQYGAEPIRLANHDIRRKQLMHTGSPNRHLERMAYSLDTSIDIQVNRAELDHLRGRGAVVGYFFYACDKDRLFNFVWARVSGDLPALDAIRDYYAEYRIEEDDFSLESAERLWKRWRTDYKKDRGAGAPRNVPPVTPLLLSERQAGIVADKIGVLLDERAIPVDPRYRQGVVAWVFCDLTTLTQHEVAKRLGRDQRRVSRSVTRFRNYVAYNPGLRQLIAYCIKSTSARSTPSATS